MPLRNMNIRLKSIGVYLNVTMKSRIVLGKQEYILRIPSFANLPLMVLSVIAGHGAVTLLRVIRRIITRLLTTKLRSALLGRPAEKISRLVIVTLPRIIFLTGLLAPMTITRILAIKIPQFNLTCARKVRRITHRDVLTLMARRKVRLAIGHLQIG